MDKDSKPKPAIQPDKRGLSEYTWKCKEYIEYGKPKQMVYHQTREWLEKK